MLLRRYKYTVAKGAHKIKTKTAIVLSSVGLLMGGGSGLAIATLSTAHADTGSTVVVTPSAMHGWTFIDDQTNSTATATGKMVSGPSPTPLGVGSAQLSVANSADGQALLTSAYAGTAISDLTNLGYSSYQSGPTLAISLAFDVQYQTADTGYQGRLVFEPYQNGAVTVGSGWQSWSPLDGSWWASKTSAAGSNGLCPQSSPCTWDQVKTNWPDASIRGNVVFKAGSGWNAFTGNVDAFTIGVNGSNTTYDFEPYQVATDKDACKDDGWKTLTASDGSSFKNQGACVSYVASNGKSQH